MQGESIASAPPRWPSPSAVRSNRPAFYTVEEVADLLRVARALLGEILETTERQLIERSGLPEIPPAAPAVPVARGVGGRA